MLCPYGGRAAVKVGARRDGRDSSGEGKRQEGERGREAEEEQHIRPLVPLVELRPVLPCGG